MAYHKQLSTTSTGKRAREDDRLIVRQLASAVRASKATQPPTPTSALTSKILRAIESGSPLPSRAKHFRGEPEYEAVGDERLMPRLQQLCYKRLESTRKGKRALEALRNCEAVDEDAYHFDEHADTLHAFANGDCDSRIEVKRAVSPFNPVA